MLRLLRPHRARILGEGFDFFGKNSYPGVVVESEAAALFARYASPPSAGRAYEVNRFIRRAKSGGAYPLITAAWMLGGVLEADTRLNIVGTSYNLAKVASPTYTNFQGWAAPDSSNYLDTGFNPVIAGVNSADFHFAVYLATGATHANSDLGLISGGNGITINANSALNSISFRANGPNVVLSNGTSEGNCFVQVCVLAGTYFVYANGVLLNTGAYTPTALVNGNIYIGGANGSVNFTNRPMGYVSVGRAMNAAQSKAYAAAVLTYIDATRGGHPRIQDAGVGSGSVTADVIVCGATAQGIIAAYEAKRQGRSVAIIGGWRERKIGGMSTNGISVADIDSLASIGGLPKLIFTRCQSLAGAASTVTAFEPRVWEIAIRGLLDPARADGLDIPIYWSDGIASVAKTGTRITGLVTADGRRVSGSQFIDATYEGDLLALAGCSNIIGREAAGTGYEAYCGERKRLTTQGGDTAQYALGATFYNVDPYITPATPGSGRLFGVNALAPTAGVADNKIQAYNFRLAMTASVARRVPWLNVAPSGFNVANYEAFLRFLAILTAAGKVYGTDYSLDELLYFVAIGGSLYDVNQSSGFGPNFYGQSFAYPAASNSSRETIWKAHESHLRGLWYVMCYGRTSLGDTRVPALLETEARTWGMDSRSFSDNHPNDDVWWPGQLYVRQARRLIGDFVYDGNDYAAADGNTPRSLKTVGCASYKIDSHHVEAIEDPDSTPPRIWNTGMVVIDVLGANKLAPIPYEAICPKVSECTNLLVPFAISATHIAFSGIRMEPATATFGQAAGLAAALAIEGGVGVQAVSYTTLRARLLASKSLNGEVDPVIPQTN